MSFFKPVSVIFSNGWQNLVSWWGHQMKTFSASLAFVRGIHRWPANSPHKGQWRGALMCTSRDADDLRRHRAHYDVTIMWLDSMWMVDIGASLSIKSHHADHTSSSWASWHHSNHLNTGDTILISRSGVGRFHPQEPDLQTSFSDVHEMTVYNYISSSNSRQATSPIKSITTK